MRDVNGKTVWITGASSGLGEALARLFAARGARVLLSARRAERLAELARTLPSAAVLPLDLAELDSLAARVGEAEALLGPIDVMVHNAGLGQRASVVESTFTMERQLMDVNFLAPVAMTKALLPGMLARGAGDFLVVSSVLGLMSVKHRAAYCASKHALHGYFNALRAELAGTGIGVLLACPGHIDSEFSRAALEGDGRPHGVDDAGTRSGMSPRECAARTIAAFERGKDEVYVTKWESAGVYLNRFAPALLRRVTAAAKAR
jgi:dehydrogenase/reductase SDR family member 7B